MFVCVDIYNRTEADRVLLLGLAMMICGLTLLIKNVVLLFVADTTLAMLHSHNKARQSFVLPKGFSPQKIDKRIRRYGKGYDPNSASPRPDVLRYRSTPPILRFSGGTERVIAIYHTATLDRNSYNLIVNSARSNFNSLKGKKKHPFLEKEQRNSPINRVAVVLIYSDCVEDKLRKNLFQTVCSADGDGLETSVLPCVVDLSNNTCTFDSLRLPFIVQYPVKNRGINIIKKYLFGGRLTLAESPDMIDPIEDVNADQSLWDFWKTTRKELVDDEKNHKKRFKNMKHREIKVEEDCIYLKWEEKGLWLLAELDEEGKNALIEEVSSWDYPKSNKISKATIKEIKDLLNTHFASLGYTTKYDSETEE